MLCILFNTIAQEQLVVWCVEAYNRKTVILIQLLQSYIVVSKHRIYIFKMLLCIIGKNQFAVFIKLKGAIIGEIMRICGLVF